MEEEACKVNPQLDNALSEKNSKKRKLKTPSQVESLEKLYSEHKYPTEALKAQLAEEQGLSEKQVSGWFCHRRLKDKNLLKDEVFANGRQELSSGIIQDRGSALKQDSCSSTKQGEYKHSEVREVESQRFYGQDYAAGDYNHSDMREVEVQRFYGQDPAADLAYGNRGQYTQTRNNFVMDGASSDSSSASQGRMFLQKKDPYDMKPARFSSQNSDYKSMNIKASKGRGYLKTFRPQTGIENAAVSAVKRQLGKQYRDDGPLLGVKFDSLPPGAFDSPVGDAINESYNANDLIGLNSPSAPKARKSATLDPGYNRYSGAVYPQSSYPKGALIKQTKCESDGNKEYSNLGSGQEPSFTKYSNHYPERIPTMDNIAEDPVGKASVLNRSRNHEVRPKHKVGLKSGSIMNSRHHPSAGKVLKSESSSYSRLQNHDDSSSHMLQRGECLDGRPSSVILPCSEILHKKNIEHPRRIEKDENLYRERRKSKECIIPVRKKMQLKEETRPKRGKRMQGDEFPPHGYASKTPSPQVSVPWETKIKGYVGEMPTSFTDDEATTTSTD